MPSFIRLLRLPRATRAVIPSARGASQKRVGQTFRPDSRSDEVRERWVPSWQVVVTGRVAQCAPLAAFALIEGHPQIQNIKSQRKSEERSVGTLDDVLFHSFRNVDKKSFRRVVTHCAITRRFERGLKP